MKSFLSARLQHIYAAVDQLIQAFQFASDCGGDRWQFAVELDHLERSGLTLTDVRFLLTSGMIEHAKETTVPGSAQRSFGHLPVTSFPRDTCIMLTPKGLSAMQLPVEAIARSHHAGDHAVSDDEFSGTPPKKEQHITPHWDEGRRELRYQGQTIKRFQVPANNQVYILQTFEEMNWPQCIDDPLPPNHKSEPKERLRATIKSLNNAHLVELLRFHLNGTGYQVYWKEHTNDFKYSKSTNRARYKK